MHLRIIITLLAGLILAGLGALWFLQGSDIVHIKPILCAANCEPVTGHMPLWQVVGGLSCLAGIILTVNGVRALKRKK